MKHLRTMMFLVGSLAGCGADVTDDGTGGAGSGSRFATLKVTLQDGTIRSCTSQFSLDQDGSPFGEPAEAIALEADPSTAAATLFAYRTDEPPMDCPPMAEPIWTGSPGDSVDWSAAPIEFGPGKAFTVQADCDTCTGDDEFQVVVELVGTSL